MTRWSHGIVLALGVMAGAQLAAAAAPPNPAGAPPAATAAPNASTDKSDKVDKVDKAASPDHTGGEQDYQSTVEVYQAPGRSAEGEPLLLRKALAIAEKAVRPEFRDVGPNVITLAELSQAPIRLAEAEPLLKQALVTSERVFGTNNPDLSQKLIDLADIYLAEGQYTDAEPLLKRARTIDEAALGPTHPKVRGDLINLALLYRMQGQLADAEPFLKQVLNIDVKTQGPETQSVGADLNNLAVLYYAQGRLPEAEAAVKHALKIAGATAGADSPMAATNEENLGVIYLLSSRQKEAEPLFLKALAANRKAFGVTSPQTAFDLLQLGDIARLQGDCVKAEGYFAGARRLGETSQQEVPLYYVTDRAKGTDHLLGLNFLGQRSSETSYGAVSVVVPVEEAMKRQLLTGRSASAAPVVSEPTRLALTCTKELKLDALLDFTDLKLLGSRNNSGEALVFIHGYNNSFEDLLRRAGQLAYDMQFDGPVFAFSWPSEGRLLGYFADSDTVDLATRHLRDFLENLIDKTKVSKIVFVAHSMGNMVLLKALDQMVREQPDTGHVLTEIIDAAPDADPDVMAELIRSIDSKGPAHFTIYASDNDRALWIRSWFSNYTRAGFIGANPAIIPGAETVDISRTGNYWGINHDLYAASPIVVDDMRRVFAGGDVAHPPDKRSPDFEPVKLDAGIYWRLKQLAPAGGTSTASAEHHTPG